jgi:hypothetical protein
MKRKFVVNTRIGVVHEMMLIDKADMDKLTRKLHTCEIVGIPAFFSEDGRAWPICDRDVGYTLVTED